MIAFVRERSTQGRAPIRDALTAAGPRVNVTSGSSGVLDDGDEADRRPDNGRWISYADVRVNPQETSVQVPEGGCTCPATGTSCWSGDREHHGWWLRMTAGERWAKCSSPDA